MGDTTFTGDIFGSALNPTVIKIFGDLTLAGNFEGYGVLYVNGDLEMDGDARWEGLVLLDDAARSLTIKGNASIYGGIVARGGLFGDPGLVGGHFDIDVFDRPTKDKIYHEHEYDDKYDVSYVNLLRSGCGKDDGGALCWDQIIGNNYQELRIELFNPGSSDGVFALTADGTRYTGSSQGGLTVTVDPSTVTEFAINFSTLQAMAQTEPKNVQKDITNRDGAFSVRIYNTANDDMIYELSVYWHYKEGGKNKDKEGEEEEAGDPLDFSISGSSGVYYSSMALMRLKDILPTIDGAIDAAVINERVTVSD